MKVELELDPSCAEPRAIIRAARMTEEVAALIRRLTETPQAFLMGFRDEQAVPLDPAQSLSASATARSSVFATAGALT